MAIYAHIVKLLASRFVGSIVLLSLSVLVAGQQAFGDDMRTQSEKPITIEFRRTAPEAKPGWELQKVPQLDKSLYISPNAELDSKDFQSLRFTKSNGSAVLVIELNAAGAAKMKTLSTELIGQPLAFVVDGKLFSAPTIRSPIGKSVALNRGIIPETELAKIAARFRQLRDPVGKVSITRDPKAEAIIVAALKAHGGEAKLNALKKCRLKSLMTMTLPGGKKDTAEATETCDWPDKIHRLIVVKDEKSPFKMEYVITGNKGWKKTDRDNIETYEGDEYSSELSTHNMFVKLPLLMNQSLGLALLPAKTIAGKPATGVRTFDANNVGCELYFDDVTHLIVKTVRNDFSTSLAAGVGGDITYSNFQPMAGLMFPTQWEIAVSGRTFMTIKITDLQLLDTIPDTLWTQPEEKHRFRPAIKP